MANKMTKGKRPKPKGSPPKPTAAPPKANKGTIGEMTIKLSVDTGELDVDLDRTIKKLKEIKRLLAIIDLKKKAKDLLSCLKLQPQPKIIIKNSITVDKKYIHEKIIPEIIKAVESGIITVKKQR